MLLQPLFYAPGLHRARQAFYVSAAASVLLHRDLLRNSRCLGRALHSLRDVRGFLGSGSGRVLWAAFWRLGPCPWTTFRARLGSFLSALATWASATGEPLLNTSGLRWRLGALQARWWAVAWVAGACLGCCSQWRLGALHSRWLNWRDGGLNWSDVVLDASALRWRDRAKGCHTPLGRLWAESCRCQPHRGLWRCVR